MLTGCRMRRHNSLPLKRTGGRLIWSLSTMFASSSVLHLHVGIPSAARPMSAVPRRRRANSGACQNSFRRIDPWAAPLPTPSLHVCDLCVRRGQLDEMALIAKRMRKVGFPIRHE